MRTINSDTNIDKKFEYVQIYRAYLISAYRSIDETLKKIKTNKYRNPFGTITPDWVYECNILMFPAMYNLKHAIEMFLKTMRHFLGLTEIRDSKNGHDLKFIFEETEPHFRKIFADKTVNEFENIILIYNEIEFNGYKIMDPKNMEFRYGDNSDCFRVFSEVKEDRIVQIKRDIKKFDEYFYKIGAKILELQYGPPPSRERMKMVNVKIFRNRVEETKFLYPR